MRSFALILLIVGPVLSVPVVAGLWARETFPGAERELYALAMAAGTLVLEGLVLLRRGVLREVAIFLLSSFWAAWMWLALTQKDYHWTALPVWRGPDPLGRMVIILAILVCLLLHEVAASAGGRSARRR
jgi:hypothetical protein